MSKQIIRLTENDLHKVIKESIKKIVKEYTQQDIDNIWDEYKKSQVVPQDESMYDEVIQTNDSPFAAAYCHTDDPMYKRVKSNTLRGMMGTENDEFRTEYEKSLD